MKKSLYPQHLPTASYELAASACAESVDIYGTSLDEVCLRHRQAIRKTISYDLRAIEQGRYALFMLSQIENFPAERRKNVSRHIVLLLQTAIETLTELENRERSKYRHIVLHLRQEMEIAAGM